jgi:hypothetical protein
VLGKLFNSNRAQKPQKSRPGGRATQRAFSSAEESNGGKKGKKAGQKLQPQYASVSSSDEGPGEMQSAVKRAGNAGIFSMFDRLK